MNQEKRRKYLITELLKEQPEYKRMHIPVGEDGQRRLLRSLMNVRMPGDIDSAFLRIQDEYLSEENEKKGIVTLADMDEKQPDLYIWKGDMSVYHLAESKKFIFLMCRLENSIRVNMLFYIIKGIQMHTVKAIHRMPF